jgi:hypothetical protein
MSVEGQRETVYPSVRQRFLKRVKNFLVRKECLTLKSINGKARILRRTCFGNPIDDGYL